MLLVIGSVSLRLKPRIFSATPLFTRLVMGLQAVRWARVFGFHGLQELFS
jgi:hypothetical protein